MKLERRGDIITAKAEKAGYGDKAFEAELRGQAQAFSNRRGIKNHGPMTFDDYMDN